MKVILAEPHPIVSRAVEMANRILKDESFYEQIRQMNKFDLSTATPAIIADLIKKSNLEFKVDYFFPGGLVRSIKYRKTLAYTDEAFPNTLFLNTKKLNRPAEDIAATIVHEGIHALDDSEDNYTFGHGNNSPKGKDNTAPYWIGNLAYKMLTGNPSAPALAFDQVEEHEHSA